LPTDPPAIGHTRTTAYCNHEKSFAPVQLVCVCESPNWPHLCFSLLVPPRPMANGRPLTGLGEDVVPLRVEGHICVRGTPTTSSRQSDGLKRTCPLLQGHTWSPPDAQKYCFEQNPNVNSLRQSWSCFVPVSIQVSSFG
jgi:hypothetical protein